jgi:hypothetical protein
VRQCCIEGIARRFAVENPPPGGALSVAEMAHGREEEYEPPFMLRDVAGLFAHFHLQHGVGIRIEPVKCGAGAVELIAEHQDQAANR